MKAVFALVALATFAMGAPAKDDDQHAVTATDVSPFSKLDQFEYFASPDAVEAEAWCGGYTPAECNNLCYWDGARYWQCTSWSCRCIY